MKFKIIPMALDREWKLEPKIERKTETPAKIVHRWSESIDKALIGFKVTVINDKKGKFRL